MKPTRRDFLRIGALAPLPTGLADAADKETCGLAIGTYGLQSLELSEAIQLVSDTGYDAIEIATFPGFTGSPEALKTPESRNSIRSLLQDCNLRLCALMADLRPAAEDTEHQKQLDELRVLIDLANDLSPGSLPLIQTILGGKDWETSKNLFRDRIADWIQIAADQRITISIKPHRSHAMSVPAEAAWLIQQLGTSRRLKMVYDFSHYAFHLPELSIEETIDSAHKFTNFVAVKDAVQRGGKVEFALAGDSGNIDHAEIIRELFAKGYRGDFCCEVSSQIWKKDPNYDPVAATKRCYENMAAAFDRADVERS